jgi:hypothetical protein
MAMTKKIVTSMKMKVINGSDKDTSSELPIDVGYWYNLEKRPRDMPGDIWDGPGVYLWHINDSMWIRVKIDE